MSGETEAGSAAEQPARDSRARYMVAEKGQPSTREAHQNSFPIFYGSPVALKNAYENRPKLPARKTKTPGNLGVLRPSNLAKPRQRA